MRKLKLQVQMSVDGYVGRPNGELDWMTWNWGDDIKKYVSDLTEPVDTIIMGRKLAEGFIDYWKGVAENPDAPEYTFGKKMNDTPKVVFTKTLDKSRWENTGLAKGDLVAEVNKLKNQDGNDIIVYGGASFVSSLIKEGLIDEINLFINPSAIGNGLPIFRLTEGRQQLELKEAKPFDCGVVVLTYGPKND